LDFEMVDQLAVALVYEKVAQSVVCLVVRMVDQMGYESVAKSADVKADVKVVP
jgi:hypothetical protein